MIEIDVILVLFILFFSGIVFNIISFLIVDLFIFFIVGFDNIL